MLNETAAYRRFLEKKKNLAVQKLTTSYLLVSEGRKTTRNA